MLRIGCLLVVAVLAIFIAIPVIASRYIPWWAVLLLIVAELALLIFAGPKVVKWVGVRILAGFMGMKSKVLRNASVEVHSITRIPKPLRRVEPEPATESTAETEIQTPDGSVVTGPVPTEEAPVGDETDPDDQEEKDPPGTRYIRIDCTLKPVGSGKATTPMQHYEPSEMMLVPYDRKVSLSKMLSNKGEDEEGNGQCHDATIVGGDPDNESGKYNGIQRIEFIFKCPPELKGRVKFQYYFEAFGDLQIPD